MIGRTYADNETGEEVIVTDVGGMRYTMVSFKTEDYDDQLCLPYFEQYFTEKE